MLEQQLAGTMTAADFTGQFEPGMRAAGMVSVRDLPIERLRNGPFSDAPLVPSHRLVDVMMASIVRQGGKIGWGVPPYPTRWASPDEHEAVLRRADLELRFEEGRRQVAPDAASRLACIWLADDTPEGRSMVSKLKGHESFVLQVRILTATRISRLDTHWLADPVTDETICGYWSGTPRDDQPMWEYLVEGAIACADDEELERLRAWVRRAAPPPGRMVAPPS